MHGSNLLERFWDNVAKCVYPLPILSIDWGKLFIVSCSVRNDLYTYEKYLNLSEFLNVRGVAVSCFVRDPADVVVFDDSVK